MNILIPYRWLLEFLDTKATPAQIAQYLSLCGPSVERINKIEGQDVLDIEVTTNRVDSMSIQGIARETAAILPQFGIPAKLKKDLYHNTKIIKYPGLEKQKKLQVQIQTPRLCPRFTAVVLDHITVAPSPELVQKRLIMAGMRPLNNIVDTTNYLMKETGQPFHAFDWDKIAEHKMFLRTSQKGETIVTLDSKKHILPGNDIVIEDGKGRIIDLCGIMGGANSHISAKTKTVLLFVQTYDPARIRQTSMTLGKRSEASALFEKSPDPEMTIPALYQGIKMITANAGAQIASQIIDIYPNKVKTKVVQARHQFLENKIGVKLSKDKVVRIFKALGFKPTVKENTYTVQVPYWRHNDISIKEDLVEEVARIYGYHNIPSSLPVISYKINTIDNRFYWEQKLKNLFKYSGFTETYTYSLVSGVLLEKTELDATKHLKLKNPLSEEWEYLRTVLWPSLLSVYQQNEFRTNHLSLFEIAHTYHRQTGLPEEELKLALVTNDDLPAVKKQLIQIFRELGINLDFKSADSSFFTSCLSVFYKNQKLGFLGVVNNLLNKKFGISQKTTVAEFSIQPILLNAKLSYRYQPIPKYNYIIEDLTFVMPDNYSIEQLLNIVKNVNESVSKVEFKDKYKNRVTITVYYLSRQKQLANRDVAPIRQNIVNRLKAENIILVGQI